MSNDDRPNQPWRARTKRDAILQRRADPAHSEEARAARRAAKNAAAGRIITLGDPLYDEDFAPLPNPRERVRCGCRRKVKPEMMYDVSTLPAEARPKGASEVCDACLSTIRTRQKWSHEDLAERLGAPPEWVAWLRGRRRGRGELA